MNSLFGCAQEKTVTICGQLQDTPDGVEVHLFVGGEHNRSMDVLTRTKVENGTFSLETTIEEPRLFIVAFPQTRTYIQVMAAPGDKIQMTGTLREPEITGSQMHQKFVEKVRQPRQALDKRHIEVANKYRAISDRYGAAYAAKDKETMKEIESTEEWKQFKKEEKASFAAFDELLETSVKENADSWWGPFIMLVSTTYLTPDMEELYNSLSDEAKNSHYGQIVKKELFGISGKAPAFIAKDRNGKTHTLDEILKDNQYVLVDFWASWCAPCRKFVPTLKELADKYANKGLVVVSISTDKMRDDWLKALDEEQMPWLNLIDESGISEAYGANAIPALYLIGKDGNLLFARQSGQVVIQKLQEIFADDIDKK